MRRTISATGTSANPGSRWRMNHAFSAIRVMSQYSGMPCARHRSWTSAMLRQAHGLAAGHVHRDGDADVRDALPAVLVDHPPQLRQVDVALERVLAGRVVRLVDDDVDERAAGQLLVQPRGGEVHVPGHHVAAADEHLGDDVLGTPALVRGHHEGVAVHVLHGPLEAVEALAAGVRLVAEHQRGPLLLRHRVRAAVGQQVDVHVTAAQQERVPARLGQGGLALGARGHPQRLDHLDLVGLRPRVAALARAFVSHASSLLPRSGLCALPALPCPSGSKLRVNA